MDAIEHTIAYPGLSQGLCMMVPSSPPTREQSVSNGKKHGRTARVERAGVLHCARVVNEMKHVWRERPISDVGIDGDIEIVEPATDTPTGRFLSWSR